MENHLVRITKISITNFKNVAYGELTLVNSKNKYPGSMLGLYGQNGSGKTAIIDSIQLLKELVGGHSLSSEWVDYIKFGCSGFTIDYEFSVTSQYGTYPVKYSVNIKKSDASEEGPDNLILDSTNSNNNFKLYECLSTTYTGKSLRMTPFVQSIEESNGLPKKVFFNVSKEESIEYRDSFRSSLLLGTSFIFSNAFINFLRKREDNDETFAVKKALVENILLFGRRELFVIKTNNTGLISMNIQPLSFSVLNNGSKTMGTIGLPLDQAAEIREDQFLIVKNVFECLNVVLTEIIPGLCIEIKKIESHLLKDNSVGYTVQLFSKRDGTDEIPLKYESEGIKKIVSVLQLIIAAYNRPSFTVAIDELDSGIFEYLLGEILRIVSEKGKGQLIFTSHNLRPLETIDREFVAFTTTNPEKRYLRMANVKETNNLRDFYYRDIVLGEQSEEVYSSTNNIDIAIALKKAGAIYGT